MALVKFEGEPPHTRRWLRGGVIYDIDERWRLCPMVDGAMGGPSAALADLDIPGVEWVDVFKLGVRTRIKGL